MIFLFSIGGTASAPSLLLTTLSSFLGTVLCYHHGINDHTWLGSVLAVSLEKTGKTSGLKGIFHMGLGWFPALSSAVSTLDLFWLFLLVTQSLAKSSKGLSLIDCSGPTSAPHLATGSRTEAKVGAGPWCKSCSSTLFEHVALVRPSMSGVNLSSIQQDQERKSLWF